MNKDVNLYGCLHKDGWNLDERKMETSRWLAKAHVVKTTCLCSHKYYPHYLQIQPPCPKIHSTKEPQNSLVTLLTHFSPSQRCVCVSKFKKYQNCKSCLKQVLSPQCLQAERADLFPALGFVDPRGSSPLHTTVDPLTLLS